MLADGRVLTNTRTADLTIVAAYVCSQRRRERPSVQVVSMLVVCTGCKVQRVRAGPAALGWLLLVLQGSLQGQPEEDWTVGTRSMCLQVCAAPLDGIGRGPAPSATQPPWPPVRTCSSRIVRVGTTSDNTHPSTLLLLQRPKQTPMAPTGHVLLGGLAVVGATAALGYALRGNKKQPHPAAESEAKRAAYQVPGRCWAGRSEGGLPGWRSHGHPLGAKGLFGATSPVSGGQCSAIMPAWFRMAACITA